MSYSTATERLSERAHESMDRVASTARKGRRRIRREAAHVRVRARDAGHKAREQSEDSLESAVTFVREHPLLCLSAAFTAGTLLAALKRRRQ